MKNDSIKLIFNDKRWWFILVCTLAVIIVGFKLASIRALALDMYFGNNVNQLINNRSDGSGYDVMVFPDSAFVCSVIFMGQQYFMISIPENEIELVPNHENNTRAKIWVKELSYDNSNNLRSTTLYQYSLVSGSVSHEDFGNFDGIDRYFYWLEFPNSSAIYGCPLFVMPDTYNSWTDFKYYIFQNYYNGVKNYRTNDVVNNNNIGDVTASVDLSGIESRMDSSILFDEKEVLYLTLIFFCVGLTMFRNVLHQFSKNVRMRK